MHRKRQLTGNLAESPPELLEELWQYIGFKLSVADRIRFRSVCKSWMSLLPSRHPPWLVLADKETKPEDPNQNPSVRKKPARPPLRGLVCLGEQSIYHVDFPELHGARFVGSTGNWLITAHKDKTLRLLNPFDLRQIYLPSMEVFETNIVGDDGGGEFDLSKIELWKITLSSSPSKWRNCIAMAIHLPQRTLAVARLGDFNWTTVEIVEAPPPRKKDVEVAGKTVAVDVGVGVDDVIFYKEQFHAITNRGELLVCDLGDGLDPPKASYLTKPIEKFSAFRVNYLVEWMGELVMVRKTLDMIENGAAYRTTKFEIYKFDFVNKKWTGLRSLGEYSLFLGLNTSVSFRASNYYGLVKKNCVYFTDDFVFGYIHLKRSFEITIPGGNDMGVFDLANKSISPHYRGASTSPYSPPVWLVQPETFSVFRDIYPRW